MGDREVCTSPVLVKRVRQSMVSALPRLRNRWRRQQVGTLATDGPFALPSLVRLWREKLQGGIIKEDMLREGALGSMAAAHTQHPLPGEETIPSSLVCSLPPALL